MTSSKLGLGRSAEAGVLWSPPHAVANGKLQIVAETVGAVVHPSQQEFSCLVFIRASRLPLSDPAAEKAAGGAGQLEVAAQR